MLLFTYILMIKVYTYQHATIQWYSHAEWIWLKQTSF